MDIKTVMVHLELEQPNDGILAITADLANRFEAAVIGIAGCQPLPVIYEETYISAELLDADREQIEKEMQTVKARLHEAIKGAPEMVVDWRCTITSGSLAGYIANEARAADLVISGPDIGGSVLDHTRRVNIADLVFRTGRPVLIVPKECNQINLSKVVVGWKRSRESRRSIVDSLPILKIAGDITLLAIASEGNLPSAEQETKDIIKWLKRHGINATAKTVAAHGYDAFQFADLVQEMGAGLVVAGAYGHSRFREWTLGGVTGDYLISPDRPVLLSH